MLKDFVALFFPQVCECCGRALYVKEEVICTQCLLDLPRTNHHQIPENPVAKLFWGRTNVQMAAACYAFSKGGAIQKLVHQMKYRGKKEIGMVLGRKYGYELLEGKNTPLFDVIVPVPLHKNKEKLRGYNQSLSFAQGLAQAMQLDCMPDALKRVHQGSTQTRYRRAERWENVKDNFQVHQSTMLKGKHVLIVDDVVTTGATLEACSRKLLEIEGTSVSILTLAFTQ